MARQCANYYSILHHAEARTLVRRWLNGRWYDVAVVNVGRTFRSVGTNYDVLLSCTNLEDRIAKVKGY